MPPERAEAPRRRDQGLGVRRQPEGPSATGAAGGIEFVQVSLIQLHASFLYLSFLEEFPCPRPSVSTSAPPTRSSRCSRRASPPSSPTPKGRARPRRSS